ncbi:leucine-rich repeat and IQ domain-containing protein 3 [Tachyglossus aculeatus]|uniref:leucine-rich repeat and IQ domain-containing protein 3 n=1 Tax=Tachyglossus aculeatus TaxID=9261 RepID=UPI0018F5A2CE|nr:leucine-rich repeat and IQ domain-containing protein 3 [Tachyglossus aculeatus]XP_038601740.1 leucine-rich repeat and IQ domain-containing protein 3 [Tachyglossus aculeatus]
MIESMEKFTEDYAVRKVINQNQVNDLKELLFIKFSGLHLRSVENLQCCISLKVCILSNNYIKNMDAFEFCFQLVKLDLHGNQMQSLPGSKFWTRLKKLKLLYLHNNGFGSLKTVSSLSSCPNLITLTMFDTPVSLERAYRHFIVNCVQSLKVLDHYVISDEEIIQDWHLPDKYKTFSRHLFLDLCPVRRKRTSFEEEMNMITNILSKVNTIVAQYSPVVIVQKWIRGYLTRRKYRKIFLHKRKHHRHYNFSGAKQIYVFYRPAMYDHKSFMHHIINSAQTTEKAKIATGTPIVHAIDLQTLPGFHSAGHEELASYVLSELKRKEKTARKEGGHPVQKYFFKDKEDLSVEENLNVNFRISVSRAPMHDPELEKNIGMVYQQQKQDHQPEIPRFAPILPHHTSKHKIDYHQARKEKRLFAKTGESMRLAPLYAIDKTYKEKHKCEERRKRAHKVHQVQMARNEVNQNVREFLEKKKDYVQKQCEKDNRKIQGSLEQVQLRRSQLIQEARQRRSLFLEEKRRNAAERLLARNFNNQHAALTKELFRLDRSRKKEDIVEEKSLVVKECRESHKRWKEVVRKMQAERQAVIHARLCEENLAVNTRAFQKANERILQAKAKVAMMNSQNTHINPF